MSFRNSIGPPRAPWELNVPCRVSIFCLDLTTKGLQCFRINVLWMKVSEKRYDVHRDNYSLDGRRTCSWLATWKLHLDAGGR